MHYVLVYLTHLVLQHTREMLSIVEVTGSQRFFCVPFMLEIVLERLFEAIDLANRSENQSSRTSVEVFVVHQRGELNGALLSSFLALMFLIVH